MGVYIRGMEMPESCIECPFKWAADSMTYCLAQTPTMKTLMPVKLHEIRWKKFSNAVEKFRWKEASCPLVPVPPHGRLIDADGLVDKHFGKEFLSRVMTDDEDDLGTALVNVPLVINNAPTIIPAEPFNNLSKPYNGEGE